MRRRLSVMVMLCAAVWLGCEPQNDQPVPVIMSFSPASGVAATDDEAGTTVTITGKNFSATPSDNQVYFEDAEAEVVTASKTQLEVVVPAGAVTGKIKVTVGSRTGMSASSFEVIEPPVISDFTPKTGIAGDEITITGQRLAGGAGVERVVRFNGAEVTEILESSDVQLKVKVPAAATSGRLSVTVNGHSGYSSVNFVVPNSPFIEAFTPVKGFAGDAVTIQGDYFDATPGGNEVRFNGMLATVTQASAAALTVQVPVGATSGKVTVKVKGLLTQSTETFEVLTPVALTSVDPTAGTAGTEVILTGEGFSTVVDENEVLFNGTVATVLSATATTLTVKVPVNATDGKIRVNVYGKQATSAIDFDVWAVPTITQINPFRYGLIGSSLALLGTDFDPVAEQNLVTINGVVAPVTASTKTSITVTIPSTTSGRITVKSHGLTGTSTSDFTPVRPQVIQEVESGWEGVIVTLFTPPDLLAYNYWRQDRTIFFTSLRVKFNGVAGQVLNNPLSSNPTEPIQVQVPASTTGKITLEQDGVVIAVSEKDFEYLNAYPFPNLPAHYRFDNDFANGSNPLPFNGTELDFTYAGKARPTFTSNRFGNANKALNFNGNQAAQTNKPIMTAGNAWTVSFWVKYGAQANNVFTNGGISFQDNNEGIEVAFIQKNDAPGADFTLRVSDGVKNSALRQELTDYKNDPVILPLAGTGDAWVNLTITCDNTKFRIYKNGNLFLEKDTPANLDMGGGGNFKVGTASGYYYTGMMDDIFIYSTALTASEVNQLFIQNLTR